MLLDYNIGRLVLVSLCVGDLVWLILSSVRVAGFSLQQEHHPKNQLHQISNTQRNKNKMTDVVIQQHSRKLLMMDILMSETCWAHKKWNKIASDIKLVFHSSTISARSCNICTYYIMLHSRTWLGKLIVSHLENYCAFYGTQRLIIMFTVCTNCLSWARLIQFTPSYSTSCIPF